MDGLYVAEGEHAWAICRSDAPMNQPLFQQWSEPLRLGYHAAIRKQGNRSRQAKVNSEFIQDSIAKDTNHSSGVGIRMHIIVHAYVLACARHSACEDYG